MYHSDLAYLLIFGIGWWKGHESPKHNYAFYAEPYITSDVISWRINQEESNTMNASISREHKELPIALVTNFSSLTKSTIKVEDTK